MVGSLLAACKDAPGENIYDERWRPQSPYGPLLSPEEENKLKQKYGNIIKKKYYGSASKIQKGNDSYIEGFEVELPCNGLTFSEKYRELKEALQSSISYAGSYNLNGLGNVKWIKIK